MLETAVFSLLHLLVFVYWLGGDLGAFYASRFLIQSDVAVDRRLLAAKIINDVDMAPRTALILALPTGLLLAISKGWLAVPMIWGWAALAVSLGWLSLVWRLHTAHGGSSMLMRHLDLAIRWILLMGLVGIGLSALLGLIELPRFIALKCLLLAGAILTGLFIRHILRPLGPALAGLTGNGTAGAEASLANTLSSARPLVVLIWLFILVAAFLGLWTPN